jgi:hypothetical protein
MHPMRRADDIGDRVVDGPDTIGDSAPVRPSKRESMTQNEKRDMPYIVGLACLAAALMVALAALWR